jgi:hypothetical protein
VKRWAVFAGTLMSMWLQPVAGDAEDIYQYGEKCAAEVTPVPAFSCMDPELSRVIPITVNGVIPPVYTPNMTCDKPSLLPSTTPGAQGQCLPGSRAVVLRDDATAQISAICRKELVRDINSALFDEINVVAHNLINGKTCWFTAKAGKPLRPNAGINGHAVPSPTAARGSGGRVTENKPFADVKPLPAADQFWQSPAQVAGQVCVTCHDSGPYMYSPYIAQTTQLPADSFGQYRPKAVGADFQQWPDAFGITTRGNTCTTCHRIGNMNSCNDGLKYATGQKKQPGSDAWSQDFPQSHWMSPGNLHSQFQWSQVFADSVSRLSACCVQPRADGCEVVRYDLQNADSATKNAATRR